MSRHNPTLSELDEIAGFRREDIFSPETVRQILVCITMTANKGKKTGDLHLKRMPRQAAIDEVNRILSTKGYSAVFEFKKPEGKLDYPETVHVTIRKL